MRILAHNIFDNIRTRVLVIHKHELLLIPPGPDYPAWKLPGGGLVPHESLAECAAREVYEETGLRVEVGRVAFLREWVVPDYVAMPVAEGEYGFGLEVFFYAGVRERGQPQAEQGSNQLPVWVPLADVPLLPIWPLELKSLATLLANGQQPQGSNSFVGDFEDPNLPAPPVAW